MHRLQTRSQSLWDTDKASIDTLTSLHSKYSGSRQADIYSPELRLRRPQPGETLSALYQDVRRLIALSHPYSLPQDARDKVVVDYFVDALDDPNYVLKCACVVRVT